MRILVLDTYYGPFLREHYDTQPDLALADYEDQLAGLMARSFGTSDAYSHNLRNLGHEARELIVNCVPLQVRWAVENGIRRPSRLLQSVLERGGPSAARLPGPANALHRIALRQVDAFNPDVIYFQDIRFHSTAQVRELRARSRLLVGQIASKAPHADHLRAFDLILTSFPHFVERFRNLGIDSQYFRIGFDERILDRLSGIRAQAGASVVFVGSLDPRTHAQGVKLLERLCTALENRVAVYGYGATRLPKRSPILACYRGQAWGLQMYGVIASAQVALNRHIGAAQGHANNMRLYEATGVRTALLTDRGTNIGELFDPGREIETYGDGDELVAIAQALLQDEPRREALAAAGQHRTLAEHTYAHRMDELAGILEERLAFRLRRPA